MKKKAIIIVLDSAGVGELPDAALFGDSGADTFGNIIKKRGLFSPNMDSLGLRNIENTSFFKGESSSGCYGKCAEKTLAKDTTCGHWEIAGFIMKEAFKTYPDGFPREIIEKYQEKIGRKVLGNYAASGTEIIQTLGDEHVKTGSPIVYTSADSVFQVAAHEDIIPLEELYSICEIGRAMLIGDCLVGRVIARPFNGQSGKYTRTKNRRDFAIEPEGDTILDALKARGKMVFGIGKIEDIFCHRGLTRTNHTTNNEDGITATIEAIKEDTEGLIFTNLVDFDMLYGHRNDIEGYARALERFDERLPDIMNAMNNEDILIITADHGCDPSTPGTDHTREYIPALIYGKNIKKDVNIGTRETFADIGATIYEYLCDEKWSCGKSFWREISK